MIFTIRRPNMVTIRLGLLLSLCFQLVTRATCAVELLGNNDLESANFHNNWICSGCRMTQSSDSYSGSHSVLVDHRVRKFSGLRQSVAVQPGVRYHLGMYIKIEHAPTSLNGEVAVKLSLTCAKNTGGGKVYTTIGREPYVRVGVWTEISGEHSAPLDVHGCLVSVSILDASVTYLVDHTSMQLVPDDRNWRQEANARIESLRKAKITVNLTGNVPSTYEVQLTQTHHQFAFGSAVHAPTFLDPKNTAYRDVLYRIFEWAVPGNALKWRIMEHHQGEINYNTSLSVIKELRNHGMKVRAHNIFWGLPKNTPDWVLALSKPDLLQAMDTRVNGVVGAVKGLVEQWDVNNENLHGNWYETATGDVNITMKMFRDAHRVDPNVKLFLNDFNVVEGWAATPLKHQAQLFKDSGVPIYGVGVQSHLKNVPLDITTMKDAIETVGSSGLPVWITELSVETADVQLRANGMEDALTLYFSLPEIEGIVIWGFSDLHIFEKTATLFEGPNVQPNVAGAKLQRLLTSTWRTDITHPTSCSESFSTSGFKGTYNISVKDGDTVVKSETFHLGNHDKTVQIHLDGPSPSIIVG